MRYLVTGITGFVGPHLANLLIEGGHEVWGLSRAGNGRETDIRDVVPDSRYKEIQFLFGDLTHRESLVKAMQSAVFDGVFHLAAQSHPPISFAEPRLTFEVNATGTVNLADAILQTRPECRLMFCSTSEVYGIGGTDGAAINEGYPMAPMNPYGVSKAAADLYVRERAASVKAQFYVTRAFSHTGQRRGRIFSISSDAYQIIRVKKGLQEPVIKVGNLSSRRAVCDVRDIVRAYAALMDKVDPGQAYNVGGDVVYSIGDLLDRMLTISGLKGKVQLQTDPALVRPIDIPVQVCDSQKCRSRTGWKPEIPIETTLTDLLAYWDKKIS
jgi:GDP-4-dehydro-6-deoxy-D-mannose reductase